MSVFRIEVHNGGDVQKRGTAWQVAADIVVTAFHVVGGPDSWLHQGVVDAKYVLIDPHGKQVTLIPIEFDSLADLAILRVNGQITTNPLPVSGESVAEGAAWSAAGFPELVSQSIIGEPSEPFHLTGKVAAFRATDRKDALQLTVDQGTAMSWHGASGSAILVDNRVVGTLTQEVIQANTLIGAGLAPLQAMLQRAGCDLYRSSARAIDARLALLDEMRRESESRCVARWLAAGLTRSEAQQLTADFSIGKFPANLRPSADEPVRVWLGEFGSGKSLGADRFLQEAVSLSISDLDAPFPVFLKVTEIVGTLKTSVQDATSHLGNPRKHGVIVVLDGADEAGADVPMKLLKEAWVLAEAWENTFVVMTSRPLPTFDGLTGVTGVPLMSDPDVKSLVDRCAGRDTRLRLESLGQSLQDALHRPLFAILYGLYDRKSDQRQPSSTAQLISNLVNEALLASNIDASKMREMLQLLARLTIDRGSPVPTSEIVTWPRLQPLLACGLVSQQGGTLSFPLPIVADWFGALSLLEGAPNVSKLLADQRRLERWRGSLIIATGIGSSEQVSSILSPVARQDPVFLAELVTEGIAAWGLSEDVAPPPAHECGRQVREAMQAVVEGIGPIKAVIAPLRVDGSVLPIATQVSGGWLVTAWGREADGVEDVSEIPSEAQLTPTGLPGIPVDALLGYQQLRRRAARPGRQSGWAWRWVLDDLVYSLSKAIEMRALTQPSGEFEREYIWEIASWILQVNPARQREINIDELKNWRHFPEIRAFAESSAGRMAVVRIGNKDVAFKHLLDVVDCLEVDGRRELHPPWPQPDLDSAGRMSIPSYSDAQLVARVKSVFEGSLAAYQQLVNEWFVPFRRAMRLAVTLPARLEIVIRESPGNRLGFRTMQFAWEILPPAASTIVDVRIGDSLSAFVNARDWIDRTYKSMLAHRPGSRPWKHMSFGASQISDQLECDAIRRQTYDWLRSDLKDISWAT